MRTCNLLVTTAVLALPLPLSAARGQQRDIGVLYGNWSAGRVVSYEARLDRPAWRWLRHGAALQVLIDRDGGPDFYGVGYEVQAFRGTATLGPYAVVGATLGMIADTRQGLGAVWSAGIGLEWRPVRFLGVDVEERYRVTDRGPRGFWGPGAPYRTWATALGLTVSFGRSGRGAGGGRRSSTSPGGGQSHAPSSSAPSMPPLMIVGRAADVVRTALDALGSPYQWGGTAENGFDCSGLIQYSYGRFGIRLPRTSRDQARSGDPVPAVLDSLRAGDILTFAAQPGGGVTHVGMYVGEGKFIHSSTTGVKLSRLDRSDPEGAYWIPRWVGARRILS